MIDEHYSPHARVYTHLHTWIHTNYTNRTHTNSKKERRVLKQPGQDKIREF